MGSHFSALGFGAQNLEELSRLVKQVLGASDPIERADGGSTYIYGTSFKASLAIHTDVSGTVICVEPFLAPDTHQRATYRGILANPECLHYGVVLVDVDVDSGSRPPLRLGFVTPHFLAWSEALEPGARVEVGLSAVAEKIELAEATASLGIVPLGLEQHPPDPRVHLTGRVEAHFLRHNEVGKQPFEWAVVDTGGMRIEVVADPNDLAGPFIAGQVVTGEFRLTGPIWGEVG